MKTLYVLLISAILAVIVVATIDAVFYYYPEACTSYVSSETMTKYTCTDKTYYTEN